jgi:hypothetical protein
MPWASRAGNCDSIDATTFQKDSFPGGAETMTLTAANSDDGKALNVTEVRTPKVEPPPYISISSMLYRTLLHVWKMRRAEG